MTQQTKTEGIFTETEPWQKAAAACSADEFLPGAVPQLIHNPPARTH